MSKDLFLNIKGRLLDFNVPKVMGILNVTPDSFYTSGRTETEILIEEKIERMLREGADIIDIGGCSTRPGYTAPDIEEEWRRVNLGCRIFREIAPDFPLSIDTFRAEIARRAVIEWKADIINDISGGADPDMWPLIAENKAAYVLTHNGKTGSSQYDDITAEVIIELSKKINELHRIGVIDIMADPGFGFGKTIDQNFILFKELDEFSKIGLPLLVGISRKSMIYKTLDLTPEDSLTGTVALDAIALEKGADILRVHDVKEAAETVKLFTKLKEVRV